MDLHDYRDVAENYDLYLESMYANKDHYAHFQEFYLDLAKRYGQGGVVDVACGTGAVLLCLAQRGIDIDGTDLSEEMCRVASEKARALGLELNIIPADMTRFSSGRKYTLAIIARSGFMHLPTSEIQQRALRNLRDQLLPRGILTLNTFDPWPLAQAAQMRTTPEDYSLRLEYVNRDGNREEIYNAITYNPYTQQMYGATGSSWSTTPTEGSSVSACGRLRCARPTAGRCFCWRSCAGLKWWTSIAATTGTGRT